MLKGLWRADADYSNVRARSDWIMDQVDIRGWAHSLGGENGDNFVKIGRGAHILMLLLPPAEAPREVKDKYWSWIEDRVLAPIKGQYPDLYSWIVEWYRRQIADMARYGSDRGREEMTNSPYVRSALAQAALELLPPLIRETLLEDAGFSERIRFYDRCSYFLW